MSTASRLDPFDDAADHDLALGNGLLDLVPNLIFSAFSRERTTYLRVLGAFRAARGDVAGLHRDLAVLVEELVDAMMPSDLYPTSTMTSEESA